MNKQVNACIREALALNNTLYTIYFIPLINCFTRFVIKTSKKPWLICTPDENIFYALQVNARIRGAAALNLFYTRRRGLRMQGSHYQRCIMLSNSSKDIFLLIWIIWRTLCWEHSSTICKWLQGVNVNCLLIKLAHCVRPDTPVSSLWRSTANLCEVCCQFWFRVKQAKLSPLHLNRV